MRLHATSSAHPNNTSATPERGPLRHTLSATANARLVCTLGNEALAACSTQAVPKPSANGRGTGHSALIALANAQASAMLASARQATRRQRPGAATPDSASTPPEQPRQLLRHPPRAPQQRRAVTHAGVEQQQNLVVHRTFSQKKALCKEGL